jgi:hypothetical protein
MKVTISYEIDDPNQIDLIKIKPAAAEKAETLSAGSSDFDASVTVPTQWTTTEPTPDGGSDVGVDH